MKHTLPVTFLLLGMFFVSQIVGVGILSQYIDYETSTIEKTEFRPLPLDMQPPEMSPGGSILYIASAIFVGTILILLIDRFKLVWVWKTWFFVAIVTCLIIVFDRFMPLWLGISLAVLTGFFKVIRTNVIVHNLSELVIYSAIVTIFVQLIRYIEIAFLLLILISLYDYLAVFKIKHMGKLADFQKSTNVFAGLFVPYEKNKTPKRKKTRPSQQASEKHTVPHPPEQESSTAAILGGGDISFPLLFTGTVFQKVAPQHYGYAWLFSIVIICCATLSLWFLLSRSKQDKYYPAMPILSAGVVIGFLIVLGISFIVGASGNSLLLFSL